METTDLQKHGLACALIIEMRMFISNIDTEFRKQLLVAIDKNFNKQTKGGKVIVDYETNYYDKYKELMQFISKAFVGDYAKTLWEVCQMTSNVTISGFIISELKDSLDMPTYYAPKNNSQINNDDGGE